MKQLIEGVAAHVDLYIDPQTGITWVENGRSGTGHGAHPNIDASGSVEGMKKMYWGECRTVKSHGFIHNVDKVVYSDILDYLAFAYCKCIGCQSRRKPKSELIEHQRQNVAMNRAKKACHTGQFIEELKRAIEDMNRPTLSNVETYVFPVLSTAHIREGDAKLLEKFCEDEREGFMPSLDGVAIHEQPYGWRILVLNDCDLNEEQLQERGFSEEFIDLLRMVKKGSYTGLWLDRDGETYEHLPSFEW